jgi:hypothetical protein
MFLWPSVPLAAFSKSLPNANFAYRTKRENKCEQFFAERGKFVGFEILTSVNLKMAVLKTATLADILKLRASARALVFIVIFRDT